MITADLDFGDLIVLHHQAHAGVVLLRLARHQLLDLVGAMERVLAAHREIAGQHIVVTRQRIRIRRRPTGA